MDIGRILATILGGTVPVLILFAVVIGPFLVMRFGYAANTAGAGIPTIVAFIYWPRRRGDDESGNDVP